MTLSERKIYIALARRLNLAAQFADKHSITLRNGGEVGSIVGSLADELATMAGYYPTTEQR